MTEKEIKKWWEGASQGYQEFSTIETRSAHYGPYSPDENELRLLGRVKGKKILELGCGGGQCSIAFAKQGAKVTGIDLSEEQLIYAKNLAKKNKVEIKFIRGTFQNLNKIKLNTQDIVFSAFAFQYSPNLKKTFEEVKKVLKKGGLFVFSLDHPLYSILSPENQKIKRSYFKTGRQEELIEWQDGSKHKFVSYYRKISDIYNSLLKGGFIVEEIIEPSKMKNQTNWVKGYWKNIYPKKLVKLISPTIIFKTRKK